MLQFTVKYQICYVLDFFFLGVAFLLKEYAGFRMFKVLNSFFGDPNAWGILYPQITLRKELPPPIYLLAAPH